MFAEIAFLSLLWVGLSTSFLCLLTFSLLMLCLWLLKKIHNAQLTFES